MADPEESRYSSEQIKHLEFIQAVVSRLGNGSFLIKGWTLTLMAAFIGLFLKDPDQKTIAAALVPLIGFWFLDGYFLRQERLFRKLYDQARIPGWPVEEFSMNTALHAAEVKWSDVLRSVTMVGFYGTLVGISLLLLVLGLLG